MVYMQFLFATINVIVINTMVCQDHIFRNRFQNAVGVPAMLGMYFAFPIWLRYEHRQVQRTVDADVNQKTRAIGEINEENPVDSEIPIATFLGGIDEFDEVNYAETLRTAESIRTKGDLIDLHTHGLLLEVLIKHMPAGHVLDILNALLKQRARAAPKEVGRHDG